MKNILGFALLFIATNSYAYIIDFGASFEDTDTGLEWLKLAPTIDRSYNDISSKFGAGEEFEGWRYATGAEFEELLINLTHTPDNDLPPGSQLVTPTPCTGGINFCAGSSRELLPAEIAKMESTSDLFGNYGLAALPSGQLTSTLR